LYACVIPYASSPFARLEEERRRERGGREGSEDNIDDQRINAPSVDVPTPERERAKE